MIIILAGTALYGVVHSWTASLGLKAAARRRFGATAERYYRLFYNLSAGVTFLPLLTLTALLPAWSLYSVPAPWVAITTLVQGLAIILLVVGFLHTGPLEFLGFAQLVSQHSAAKPRLAIKGLYRYVRHPLYTAGLLFIWLTPVMTTNVLALNLGLTLYIIAGTHIEERKLAAEFHPAYAEYQARTPMLVPGVKRLWRRL